MSVDNFHFSPVSGVSSILLILLSLAGALQQQLLTTLLLTHSKQVLRFLPPIVINRQFSYQQWARSLIGPPSSSSYYLESHNGDKRHSAPASVCMLSLLSSRAEWGHGTFFSTHGNHLPSLSGVHGLKDFLWSDHLLESFNGRSYTHGSVLKSNFYHKTTQEDGHYRENPSNHELLTVRGGDCRVWKKMFRGLIPL